MPILFITSAKDGMLYLHCVCLFVCLLAASHKTNLHEHFTNDVSLDKEGTMKFWKSSGSGSGSRIFEGIFTTIFCR